MITYKTECKIQQSFLYLAFLSLKFIETVLVTFLDTIPIAHAISSHTIFKLSTICFICLLFSQKQVLWFKLWYVSLFNFWFELHVALWNLHLKSDEICFINNFASFLFVIILNTLTFTSFALQGKHIFADKSSTELQPPLHFLN